MAEAEKVALIFASSPQDLTSKDFKDYMRIDFDDEDNDRFIDSLLLAAKSFVQSYLNWKFDDPNIAEVPKEITIAVLAIGEHWYKNRGILPEEASKQELPYVFSGILDMHRNWQVGSGNL